MRHRILSFCAALGMTLQPNLATALSAEGKLEEPDPHGAVLCAWHIYVFAAEIGDLCFPQRDEDFKVLLRKSIERMDAFIIENAPATIEEVEVAKKQIRDGELSVMRKIAREREPNVSDLCETAAFQDGLEFYNRIRAQPTETMETGVTKLLSVPRKPVMNPCL